MRRFLFLVLLSFFILQSYLIKPADTQLDIKQLEKNNKNLDQIMQNFFACYIPENKSADAEELNKRVEEAIKKFLKISDIESCLQVLGILICIIDHFLDQKDEIRISITMEQLKKFKDNLNLTSAELQNLRDILYNQRLQLQFRNKKNSTDVQKIINVSVQEKGK